MNNKQRSRSPLPKQESLCKKSTTVDPAADPIDLFRQVRLIVYRITPKKVKLVLGLSFESSNETTLEMKSFLWKSLKM